MSVSHASWSFWNCTRNLASKAAIAKKASGGGGILSSTLDLSASSLAWSPGLVLALEAETDARLSASGFSSLFEGVLDFSPGQREQDRMVTAEGGGMLLKNVLGFSV